MIAPLLQEEYTGQIVQLREDENESIHHSVETATLSARKHFLFESRHGKSMPHLALEPVLAFMTFAAGLLEQVLRDCENGAGIEETSSLKFSSSNLANISSSSLAALFSPSSLWFGLIFIPFAE